MKEVRVEPLLENLVEVTAFIEEILEENGVPTKDVIQMDIAIDEILANIIHYSGATEATVGCQVENGVVTLRFADNGSPYDPTQKEDPDITLSAADRQIGGLGIFMVKKFMTSVTYAFEGGRNVLTLVKELT